jgi:hypothetical protein
MNRSGQDRTLERQELKRQQLEAKQKRLREAHERLDLRVQKMEERSRQLRQELDEAGLNDMRYQPTPRPHWPTYGYLLKIIGIYMGIAVLIAALAFVVILIYSFPLYIGAFVFGAVFMKFSMRAMRGLSLRASQSRLFRQA